MNRVTSCKIARLPGPFYCCPVKFIAQLIKKIHNRLEFKYIVYLCIWKELLDSIALQTPENGEISNLLHLFLTYFAKCLFIKRLCQTFENLNNVSSTNLE